MYEAAESRSFVYDMIWIMGGRVEVIVLYDDDDGGDNGDGDDDEDDDDHDHDHDDDDDDASQGAILIAVNPLQIVPGPDMSEYMDHPLNPEAPHPFAIAEVRTLHGLYCISYSVARSTRRGDFFVWDKRRCSQWRRGDGMALVGWCHGAIRGTAGPSGRSFEGRRSGVGVWVKGCVSTQPLGRSETTPASMTVAPLFPSCVWPLSSGIFL